MLGSYIMVFDIHKRCIFHNSKYSKSKKADIYHHAEYDGTLHRNSNNQFTFVDNPRKG